MNCKCYTSAIGVLTWSLVASSTSLFVASSKSSHMLQNLLFPLPPWHRDVSSSCSSACTSYQCFTVSFTVTMLHMWISIICILNTICLLSPGYFSPIPSIPAVCPFLGTRSFLSYVSFKCPCFMHILYLFPLRATLTDVIITGSCFMLDLILASILSVQISPSFSFAWCFSSTFLALPSFTDFALCFPFLCHFHSLPHVTDSDIIFVQLHFFLPLYFLFILLGCQFLLWQLHQCHCLFMNHLLFQFVSCMSFQDIRDSTLN